MEREAQVSQIATDAGIDAERLVKEAALHISLKRGSGDCARQVGFVQRFKRRRGIYEESESIFGYWTFTCQARFPGAVERGWQPHVQGCVFDAESGVV